MKLTYSPTCTYYALPLKAVSLFLLFITVSACSEPALVPNIADGEKIAGICGQCHGKNGISIIPIYPNLAGQKQGYLELQLQAFRSGQRVNAAMSGHAKRLSDQDIVNLSAFYANMDPSGKRVSTPSNNRAK